MCDDHLADRVGVYESHKDDEGDKVGVQDLGVQREVGGDDAPAGEEWEEAEEGFVGVFSPGTAGFEDVEGAVVALLVNIGGSDIRMREGTYLWKLPVPMIFFFERARKTPETTSNVGSS